MSYQTSEHAIATTQNLELIILNINRKSNLVIDIGANQCALSNSLALLGFNVKAIEQQDQFIQYGIKKAEIENIKNIEFVKDIVSEKNLHHLDGADTILLLSVHHQMVKELGLKSGNNLLIQIFKKAQKQLFFQPATIYEKHGVQMPWPENDYAAIESYFLNLFKGIRDFKFRNLGLVDNRLPNSEPLRPLYLFEFVDDFESVVIPSAPSNETHEDNQIVQIPVEKCVSHYWSSYSANSWNFMRAQIRQLKELNSKNGKINVEDSILNLYLQKFQPATYEDAARILGIPHENLGILGRQSTKRYFPINLYNPDTPESVRDLDISNIGHLMPEDDAYHCGPRSKDQIMREINRLTSIYRSIYQTGYKPELNIDGYIRGFYLVKDDSWVFVVTAGAHRLAAMSELGYAWFKARIQPGKPKVLDLNKISELPTVKSGAIKESEILAFYEPYFRNNYAEFSTDLI